MGLDPKQFLAGVVRPTLAHLGLPGGETAVRLVFGTAAKESDGFEALRQRGGGPALGLYQMEPATFRDLWDRFLRSRPLKATVWDFVAQTPSLEEQLVGNLFFATAMCRVKYYASPFAMPDAAAPEDLALIWKRFYNTPDGKGTPAEFLEHYRLYCAPALGEAL